MPNLAVDATKATDLLGFSNLSEGMLVDVFGEWCPDLGWLPTIVHEKTDEHVIFGKWAQVPGSGAQFMGMTAKPSGSELLVQKLDDGRYPLRVRKTDLKAVLGTRGRASSELE